MRADNPDGWDIRGFIDQSEPNVAECDPWDPLSLLVQSSSSESIECSKDNPVVEQSSIMPVSEELERLSYSIDTPVAPLQSQPIENPDDELDFPDDWFWDNLEVERDTEPLESPVPVFEYDPNLGDDLYQGAELIDLTDVDIRLDLFLASVGLSKEQDIQIRRHFETFSRARLSNWLAWLNSKEWTGETLMLFAQFHNHWESNPEWWEIIWYHPIHGWQWQQSTSSVLSRNEAYHIFQCRIDFPPDAIIDPAWFEEWECQRLWRHSFYSFAAFAKFRADLGGDEDWESLIERRSVEEDLWLAALWDTEEQVLQSSNKGRTVGCDDDVFLYSYTTSLSRWCEIQDWYPKSEWHDNLS